MIKCIFNMTIIVIFLLQCSCRKENYEFKETSSFYVVNAAVDNISLKASVGTGNGFTFVKAVDVVSGSSNIYGSFNGPNEIVVVNSADTSRKIFNEVLNLRGVNTLYVGGQLPNLDTILRTEKNLPYISQGNITNLDNSFYLRFVNLSPNSSSISVNIKQNNTNEVSNLKYKAQSEFKKYEALPSTSNYVFEIRDATTNKLLLTYTLVTGNNRFKTISLVMKGLVDGNGVSAFGTFLVIYS